MHVETLRLSVRFWAAIFQDDKTIHEVLPVFGTNANSPWIPTLREGAGDACANMSVIASKYPPPSGFCRALFVDTQLLTDIRKKQTQT